MPTPRPAFLAGLETGSSGVTFQDLSGTHSCSHGAIRQWDHFEPKLSSGHTEDAGSSHQQSLSGPELVADLGPAKKLIGRRHGITGQVCLLICDRGNEIRVQLLSRVAECHGRPHSMTGHGQNELITQAHPRPSDSVSSGSVTLEVIEVHRGVVIILLGRNSQKKGLVEP